MKYYDLFYNGVNRQNTFSYKWDSEENIKYSFAVADSDYITCPEIIEALQQRVEKGYFGYEFKNPKLVDVYVDWFKRRHNILLDKEMISESIGVMMGINCLFKILTKQGDKILINTPIYNPFYDVVLNNHLELLQSKVKRVDLNDYLISYKLDFNDLEEKIKKAKIYLLCNPHNPVGRIYSKEELLKIVELCKKYDTYLIVDEVHSDIIMEDNEFTSAAYFFKDYDKIIILNAISKTFNLAELFYANVIFSNIKLKKEYEQYLENNFLSIGTIQRAAAFSAYSKCDQYVDEQNIYLNENKKIVEDFVKEHKLKVALLQGTYLMWIDLASLNLKSDELNKKIRDLGILINPGSIYDVDSPLFIRLNVACPRKQLLDGLSKLKTIF